MSLARAIETGDLAQLPSRRDEDWRWTDLRGLIRELPAPSQFDDGELAPGVFDAVADQAVAIVNGESRTAIAIASAKPRAVALRFVAVGPGAHAAAPKLNVTPRGHLILLETYEGDAEFLSEIDLAITV